MGNMNEMDEQATDLKHDIRNPLYIAKNLIETHLEHLEALSETPQEPATLSKTGIVLRKSLKEIDRVLSIIQRLNQIAKESNEFKRNGKFQCVHIKEILYRVTAALRQGYAFEHVTLIEFIDSALPPIEAHPLDLEEIFFNLISNAAQAMIDGGQLTIRAWSRPEPVPAAVVISFEDTGHGISEEALPYIFDPFYTNRTEKGGVGFGLYIVKQLVERNGGHIAVESRPNTGTTFELTFPSFNSPFYIS